MPAENPLQTLAQAISDLTTIVGVVGTDASLLQRVNASQLTKHLDRVSLYPVENTASIDLPSGRSGRLKVLFVERGPAMARAFSPDDIKLLVDGMQIVMEAEMPVILPRWAFDQVMRAWLGEMQLSASMVLSNQRTVVMVERTLMVRVSKMMSDPRSQMVSLREQTVRNLESDPQHLRDRIRQGAPFSEL